MIQASLFEESNEPIAESLLRFIPRDYQTAAIGRTFNLFDSGVVGVIVRIPTGGGKTLTGSFVIARWLARGENYRALVIAHERQLIWQFAQEIEDVFGESPGIEMSVRQVDRDNLPRITIASRQTLEKRVAADEFTGEPVEVSRIYKFDPKRFNWLIVPDECHRWALKLKSCGHIYEWFACNPETRWLGLTATPERGDKTSLKNLFPGIASDYRLYDLDGGPCAVSDGWAVRYDQRFITVEGIDWKNIKEVKGDFSVEELDQLLNEREMLLKLVKPTLDLVKDRRTLIFSPTVAMAQAVAGTINAELKDAEASVSISGETPEPERKEVYRRHQRGEFQFLSVCGLCREGYNDPGIQAVAIYRPTKSRSLAEQMKGRGCRPLRGIVDGLPTPVARRAAIAGSDKPDCMIIDLVGCTGLADCATTAHIMAQGKPDAVIERANELALKAKEPVMLGQLIVEAEKQLKREEAERKAAREAHEEYLRRARLKGDVRYTEQRVDPGHGAGSHRDKGKVGARMIYGKHKGRLVKELNTKYLSLLMAKAPPRIKWLRDSIDRELRSRGVVV